LSVRDQLQNGSGRRLASVVFPAAVGALCWYWWPADATIEEKILTGLQKVSFVAAAFAVTAYNLRTRVVDLVLKVEGKPARVDEFCRIARNCGKRLTNLVLLFTFTAVWMGGLVFFKEGSPALIAGVGAVALFVASLVSFVYVLFAFERLERFALDEAEETARRKDAERLAKI
jgi:hypothetical protein